MRAISGRRGIRKLVGADLIGRTQEYTMLDGCVPVVFGTNFETCLSLPFPIK
jgi:hypothetical protein